MKEVKKNLKVSNSTVSELPPLIKPMDRIWIWSWKVSYIFDGIHNQSSLILFCGFELKEGIFN